MMISACMIVRDGEDTLERALASLKGYVDEIVVAVDSRTTDKTRDIIDNYTPKIWCPTNPAPQPPRIKTFDYDWDDDFSHARNLVASRASNDLILVIDADDELEPGKQDVFRQALTDGDGVRFIISTGPDTSIKSIRVYNRKTARYIYRVHEYLEYTAGETPVVVDVPITITHRKGREIDPGRNRRILESTLKEYPRYLFYYGGEMMRAGEWEEAILSLEKYLGVSTWKPEQAEAAISIAKCHLQLNDLESAKTACFRVIQIDPNFAPAYDTLGQIAAATGDYHSAIRWYWDALNVEPTHYIFDDGANLTRHAYSGLADAYREIGNTKMAGKMEKRMRGVK